MTHRALLLAILAACSHPGAARSTGGRNPMSSTHEVRHVSVSIERSPAEVYEFASNPENLPRWASGVARTIRYVNGEWIADAPDGPVRVRFVPRNELGVLDHEVVLASGVAVHVPIRVIPNGSGSEVVLTLIRQRGVPDEKFAEDARWVERDLNALKRLLERQPRGSSGAPTRSSATARRRPRARRRPAGSGPTRSGSPSRRR